jgi:GNAT superfamily N-acetyltransferase
MGPQPLRDPTFCKRMIEVREMEDRHAGDVARLHAGTITEGFLVRLGHRFLRELYRGIATDEGSHVWIAQAEGDVVGFCAYSQDVRALYRRLLRARGVRLAFASLPYSLNPGVLKEVLETWRYPAKQSKHQLPPAEILSIGMDAGARGTGAGKRLLNEALSQARREGQAQIKVLAGAKLRGANRFYQACGFDLVDGITQHGEILNVYVKHLADSDGSADSL